MTKQQNTNALQALLNEKMRIFADSFCGSSRQLFADCNGNLVHPGEFGAYREAITKDFLRALVPQRMAIDSGFVITSTGSISTQCDLVIYDISATPLLQNENRQRFFPVESVCAVGEVKSVLSLADLKAALLKLASVKSLRDSLHAPSYTYTVKEEGLQSKYEPHLDERDQIITFLICEKFSFDINKHAMDVLACYVEDHPLRPANLRHNLILSIKDGLMVYLHPSGTLFQFPVKSTAIVAGNNEAEMHVTRIESRWLKNRLVLPLLDSHEHIRHFSTMLHQGLFSVSVLFPDMGRYILAEEDVQFKDMDAPR